MSEDRGRASRIRSLLDFGCREDDLDVSANVRRLPDEHLAAKACGGPTGGGRGTYVSFCVPGKPELATLAAGPIRAGELWSAHRGVG